MLQDKDKKSKEYYIHIIEDSIVVILLTSILVFSLCQVILRNFFESGFVWGDSLLRVLVLWLGLAGAILASRQGKQIRIDVLSQFIPEPYKSYVKTLTNLFAAAICTIICIYSFEFVQTEYIDGSYIFEKVPAWIAEVIIPITFGLMAIKYILVSRSKVSNSNHSNNQE